MFTQVVFNLKHLSKIWKLSKKVLTPDDAAKVQAWKANGFKGDIVITIPDQLLFNSGEAAIRTEALPFLEGLGTAIVELNRHTRVEGHTDNVPIRTTQFPSNWELSAARAVMVVRVLSELFGVPPDHLAAVGHADTRPVTANLDSEQRAKNRRVEVVILEQAPQAPLLQTGTDPDTSEGPAEELFQDPIQLVP